MEISLYTPEECEKIAASAALRYISDSAPGLQRRKYGRGFAYYNTDGKRITEKNTLERIKALAIPPAYQNVWICPYANGHLQVTARDDKNKKQYIYHSLWNDIRQQQKFDSLIEFGSWLPHIRRHVKQQLKKSPQPNKEQVICAIIYLLDTAYARIGNPSYAKNNQSYGITTLRKKHLSLTKKKAVFDFSGKNSQLWHVTLKEPHVIKLLKKCEEIPGYEIFKYYNESGQLNIITSQDVNGYLQALTHPHHQFTAKTFRTWIACREIFYRLAKGDLSSNTLKETLQEVALLLGHTPAICRKNYIDPEIINWWQEGRLSKWIKKQTISLTKKDKLFLYWLKNKS